MRADGMLAIMRHDNVAALVAPILSRARLVVDAHIRSPLSPLGLVFIETRQPKCADFVSRAPSAVRVCECPMVFVRQRRRFHSGADASLCIFGRDVWSSLVSHDRFLL
jgi:hypothetical protein